MIVLEGADSVDARSLPVISHGVVLAAKETLDWDRPFKTVRHGSFVNGDINWFPEGALNACYNCVDRWAFKHPDKVFLLARFLPNVSLRAPARRGPGRTAGRKSECDFRRVYGPMI